MTKTAPDDFASYPPSQSKYNLVTAPAAGAVIVSSGQLPRGLYAVRASGSYGGVADVIDNMVLMVSGKPLTVLPVIPVANSAPVFVDVPVVMVQEGEHVDVVVVAAGAINTVYRGIVIVTPIISMALL